MSIVNIFYVKKNEFHTIESVRFNSCNQNAIFPNKLALFFINLIRVYSWFSVFRHYLRSALIKFYNNLLILKRNLLHMQKTLITTLALVGLARAGIFSAGSCPSPSLQANFQAQRYMGLWNEQARDGGMPWESNDC